METDSLTEQSDHQPGQGGAEDLPGVTEPEGFFQRIRAILKRPETFTLLGALAFFCGLLWFGPEGIENFKTIREALRDLLAGAFRPPAGGEVSPLAVVLAVFILGAVFVSTLYALVTHLATRNLRRDFRQLAADLKTASSERDRNKGALERAATETKSLQDALQTEREQSQAAQATLQKKIDTFVGETVRTVSQISRGSFASKDSGKGKSKSFRYVRLAYHVLKDFSAEVHRRYAIRAGDTHLHLWIPSLDASGDAEPAADFADIQFRLIGRDINAETVYLPSTNDRFHKSPCIFFLPPIPPGEEREFEIVYLWPGMVRGMQRFNWEDFSFSFGRTAAIEEFEFEVYLEDGTGGTLSNCKQIGVNLPGHKIASATNDRGWPRYRYLAANVLQETLSEEIVARVEWKRT